MTGIVDDTRCRQGFAHLTLKKNIKCAKLIKDCLNIYPMRMNPSNVIQELQIQAHVYQRKSRSRVV